MANCDYLVVDLKSGKTEALNGPSSRFNRDEFKTTKLVLRVVPAGVYICGRDASFSRSLGVPFYTRIERPYAIGIFPVTQAQYSLVTGKNPSSFKNATDSAMRPVEQVLWADIRRKGGFLDRLSALAHREFSLPSDNKWEVACRAVPEKAGEEAVKAFIDGCSYLDIDKIMWYSDNSGNETHVVGGKLPNAWGLYDMQGNVYEWTSSEKEADYKGTLDSPAADVECAADAMPRLVSVRGGSYCSDGLKCRIAIRGAMLPDMLSRALGFRVAMKID